MFFLPTLQQGWSAPKSAMIGGAGVNNAGEPPFEIRGFSLGNLVIGAGVLITLASFAEYLGDSSDSLSVSGLGFVYGIPIFLAGAALKYAEIDPVPVITSDAAEALFESAATETISKIKQDVTRHRYGDEAHLDTTVNKLGSVVTGKAYPQLIELRQDIAPNGKDIEFTMVWQSLDTPYKMWADERRVQKYETFFGPKVKAEVVKIDAEQRLVGIKLTTQNFASEPVAAYTNGICHTIFHPSPTNRLFKTCVCSFAIGCFRIFVKSLPLALLLMVLALHVSSLRPIS